MAALITAEVSGQTQQGYAGMRQLLAESIRTAPGFFLHAGRGGMAHDREMGDSGSRESVLRQTCRAQSASRHPTRTKDTGASQPGETLTERRFVDTTDS